MKNKIKIGYIGLGRRGTHVLQNNIVDMEDIEIAMICDLCVERMHNATALITEKGIITGDFAEGIKKQFEE